MSEVARWFGIIGLTVLIVMLPVIVDVMLDGLGWLYRRIRKCQWRLNRC